MILQRNKIPTSDLFSVDYLKIKNISDDTHLNIMSSLSSANSMYNNSSVMEDVILEEFLSLYTQAKDVTFNGKNKNTVTESFLTTTLSDSSFPTDKRLNIDTQNGNVILPTLNTNDVLVSSIIVESDSNGSSGNSFSGGINNDINVILSSASQAIYEYEKISSSTDTTSLTLSLTLKLDTETITNAVYIKLFAINNGAYPIIDLAEISKDGITWTDIKNFGATQGINQADYFIRFLPQSISYVRLRFQQNTYDSIKTIFGYRYRSVIGIREITPKQIEYDTSGEYVSIPFSIDGVINSATINYGDVSNNDISYFISGNNGGKWIHVNSNGSTISVTNQNAGILDGNEVRTLRLKISMSKVGSILNKINTTEYLSLSSNNKYYLKQVPTDINIFCGKHISFGRLVRYVCERQNVPTKNFLLKYVPYTTALLTDSSSNKYMRVYLDDVLQDDTAWDIQESSDPNNCEIIFPNNIEGSTQVTVDFSEILYTPNVLLNKNSNIITLPTEMFFDIEKDIIIKETTVGNITTQLAENQYKILNKSQIQIQNSSFRSTSTYAISYIPSFKINNSFRFDMNEVEISAMIPANNTAMRFDYSYQNAYDTNLIKYYTPIGSFYSVEIK